MAGARCYKIQNYSRRKIGNIHMLNQGCNDSLGNSVSSNIKQRLWFFSSMHFNLIVEKASEKIIMYYSDVRLVLRMSGRD